MALFIMPCHDSCDADDHSITVTIETAQDHHESESDFCSPFCSCACCATAIQGLTFVEVKAPAHFSINNFVLLNPDFCFISNSSIWQPPKLG
ncbi:MAG: hypothetical protein IPJ66_05255 [Bacteroidetes bacterium]|nr:hypothetical protein [Bacteroidota bacterium]MBL0066289.1 hypothetical protein [Bacteroidota bacterium]MBL0139058.1 hypothetical protein [Bacteroidota bacterium]